MKMKLPQALVCATATCCFGTSAFAYEFENAVPLTLGMQLGAAYVNAVHIKLLGHEVDVAIALRNDTKLPQQAGFYAATPLFENLGDGEEYSDKSFPEFRVRQDGKELPVSRHPRAYFLGQDITAILRKAGVGPIPSNQVNWKKLEKLPSLQNIRIKDWQAQLTYGWSGRIGPASSAQTNISYSALPKFGLETIDDERMTHLVQQHCGSPEDLRALLRRSAPNETQVFAEVFQFPLPFLKLQDTRVTIGKPTKLWMGTRPIATLACGFDGPLALPSDGMIRSANHSISILVVSLLSSAHEGENPEQ